MELNLATDLFGKLKTVIFGHGRSRTGKKATDADYLVKMNLPPLLGRRDAVYERFTQQFSLQLLEQEPHQRFESYRGLLELLNSAVRDTDAVVVTLSNADTSLRERRLLNYFELLAETLTAAAQLVCFENRMLTREESLDGFLAGDRTGKLKRRVNVFQDSEKKIVTCVADLIEMAEDSIRRHRDYTRKNFNAHNAARYHRAFADFSGIALS